MQKLVVQKGYTITVDSWENDADYRQTHSIVVNTLEEAKEWNRLMELCKREVLGNTYGGFNEEQIEIIEDFFKTTTLEHFYEEGENLNECGNSFDTLVFPLMGESVEEFNCRLMEKCTITYSAIDIYCDIIEF